MEYSTKNYKPLKKNKKENLLFKIVKSPLVYSTLMLTFAGVLYCNETNKETEKDEIIKITEKIETNIENLYALEDYEFVGFSAIDTKKNYIFEVIGYAKNAGSRDAYSMRFGYEIDESFFNHFLNIKTNKDAEFFLRIMETFTREKAQQVIKGFEGPVHIGADLKISSVEKPQVNNQSKTVSFVIETVASKEENSKKVVVSTYKVSFPLTERLAKNPNLALKDYLIGEGSFELEDQKELNEKAFNLSKVKTQSLEC